MPLRTQSAPPRRVVTRGWIVLLALLVVAELLLVGVRASLMPEIDDVTRDLPGGAQDVVELGASRGLLLLVLAFGVVVAWTWIRRPGRRFLAAAAAAGVVLAYAISEAVKLLVHEQRPCRTLATDPILACPATGDWSWPSNHATIGAALAAACIVLLPRAWVWAVPVALVVAASRVLAGVHYPHDVVAGLVLGSAVVLMLVRATSPRRPRPVRPRA